MSEENYKVVLNVYDLSQGLARQLSTSLLGKAIEAIWHTGIYVYGNEYYFGGGIQSSPGGQTPYGRPYKTIELGFTQIPKEMFEDYLQEISPRYTAQTYNLLHHNCNNFSEEVSQFLLGVSIPNYILKLPEEIMNSPMGALIMPMIQQFETTLRYGGVPQVPHATGLQAPMPSQNSNQSTPSHVGNSTQLSSINPSSGSKEKNLKPENVDKLGEARARIQNGITSEFASLMADGNIRASEAAVIATRKVMGLETPSNEPKSGLVITEKSSHGPKSEEKASPKTEEKASPKNADKLGEAKARIQAEIMSEFSALMAEGSLRASEAAALATRRVMERHGRVLGVASQA